MSCEARPGRIARADRKHQRVERQHHRPDEDPRAVEAEEDRPIEIPPRRPPPRLRRSGTTTTRSSDRPPRDGARSSARRRAIANPRPARPISGAFGELLLRSEERGPPRWDGDTVRYLDRARGETRSERDRGDARMSVDGVVDRADRRSDERARQAPVEARARNEDGFHDHERTLSGAGPRSRTISRETRSPHGERAGRATSRVVRARHRR